MADSTVMAEKSYEITPDQQLFFGNASETWDCPGDYGKSGYSDLGRTDEWIGQYGKNDSRGTKGGLAAVLICKSIIFTNVKIKR